MTSGNSSMALAWQVANPSLEDDAPAAEAQQAAAKANKQQQLLAKKTRLANKSFQALVTLMAKCRSQLLIHGKDPKLLLVLNKAEKECGAISSLLSGSPALEDMDDCLAGIQLEVTKIQQAFPDIAGRPKAAKKARQQQDEQKVPDDPVLPAGHVEEQQQQQLPGHEVAGQEQQQQQQQPDLDVQPQHLGGGHVAESDGEDALLVAGESKECTHLHGELGHLELTVVEHEVLGHILLTMVLGIVRCRDTSLYACYGP